MTTGESATGPNDIRERLASAWQAGRVAEAYGILIDEVRLGCVRWLVARYGPRLSFEDAEDCFEHGMEKLVGRSENPGQVTNPYSYVWTCAKHEALDTLRERGIIVRFDPGWLAGESDEPSEDESVKPAPRRWLPEAAQVVMEAALEEEVDPRQNQVRDILSFALTRLTPRRRRVIELLLERGPEIANAVLAELLGQVETTVRSTKKRAFDDLRIALPRVAAELGIDFDRLLAAEPDVIVQRPPSFPSPEEDMDPLSSSD